MKINRLRRTCNIWGVVEQRQWPDVERCTRTAYRINQEWYMGPDQGRHPLAKHGWVTGAFSGVQYRGSYYTPHLRDTPVYDKSLVLNAFPTVSRPGALLF